MQSGDTNQGTPQGTTPKSYPSTLPPWEAYKYFQPVIETLTLITSGAAAAQVLKNDPMRIAFIAYVNASDCFMTTKAGNSPGTGIRITTTSPLFMVQSVYGPLVQSEWYCSATSVGAGIQIIEARLSKWPGH